MLSELFHQTVLFCTIGCTEKQNSKHVHNFFSRVMFHVQRIGLDTRYFEFVMEGGGGGDNTCEPQFGIKLSKVCEINVTRQQVE